MRRVGFSTRLGAALLDMVIVLVAGALLGFLLGGTLGGLLGGVAGQGLGAIMGAMLGGAMGAAAMVSLVSTVYGLIEGFVGQSPGKMILGIIIREQDGSPAARTTLLARYAVKNASTLLSLLAGITGSKLLESASGIAGVIVFLGCFLVLGASRLALHDMIAKTAVYPK